MAPNPLFLQDEINALRRLMESVNKLSTSNSQSLGKLAADNVALRAELATTKQTANRALQMCNQLSNRLATLESGSAQL